MLAGEGAGRPPVASLTARYHFPQVTPVPCLRPRALEDRALTYHLGSHKPVLEAGCEHGVAMVAPVLLSAWFSPCGILEIFKELFLFCFVYKK